MPRNGKGQKVQTAPGQTYGKALEQEEAQKVAPLPQQPVPRMAPGSQGGLTRPTERPRQPITAGAPVGPGGGPEMVAQPPTGAVEELSERLRTYLPILETKAAQPDASANFRMFVRRVRALAARSPGEA
ncbi:hypothetical protein CMI37_31585 [Candidatus Pacearchaeota archaeon]|jgi:hypothetical protein|nr:hypothetical protein [Candidatus Pacearchaeota archaeon]|tara:strand:- start:1624 stop:2010 length:387 start_codon:yes stop_codon:yes gene_type:complete